MAAVRTKLKQFREVVRADIDRERQQLVMEAKPSFDQYVALAHAIEDAGGAIQMFHPEYVVPQAHYAALGVKGFSREKLTRLEKGLQAIPGVRSALVDPDRWFRNERGVDVGGCVVFADTSPRLDLQMVEAARAAGFILEHRHHGHEADAHDEWSEMNHAFAGLCMLLLACIGAAQLGLHRPPWLVRYGTVFVWSALFLFLFICADRSSWPLGKVSWLEGFREWDTAQHRIGLGLMLPMIAGDLMRIRKGWKVDPSLSRWGALLVGVAGSAMLFGHLHQTIDPAHAALAARMNFQHLAMATSILLFAVSRFAWETWRKPRWLAYLPFAFLGMLGVILTMYVE